MNKIIKIIGISILVVFTCTYANSQKKYQDDIWTVAQVKKMAEKYNLQDEVSETENTMLLIMSREQIEQYFKKVYQIKKETNDYKTFLEKTKLVRSYRDYFTLVNSLPYVKKEMVESAGGIDKFEAYQKKVEKQNWRIYRHRTGNLTFVEANTPVKATESQVGQRLDNLPSAKE